MKTCPTCDMTVNSDEQCPICRTSLVYEPLAHTDREQLLWNRYYALYLLRTLWFSVTCFVICVVRLVGWYGEMQSLCMPIVLLNILSIVLGLTQHRAPSESVLRFHTKEYFQVVKVLSKYLSAATAVCLATLPIWL